MTSSPPPIFQASSPQVLLRHGQRYDRVAIAGWVEESLGLFLGKTGLHGRKVLLKPNLISAGGPGHAVTHPEFIAAVATTLLDRGARVSLGDSPAFGNATRVCLKRGITKALAGMPVEIVDFIESRPLRFAHGVVLPIASAALNCDLLIGLPKIKAHNQMLLTLATKNLFGVVKGVNKALLHMTHGQSHQPFAEILSELPGLLPPQFHFADGIVAMHGSGPLDGASLPLYCMAAAVSPVALDTALMSVLEVDHQKSPLWRVAARHQLPGWDPRSIVYPGLLPESFHGSGFRVPLLLNPVRFNPLRFVRGLWRRALLRVGLFSA